ncbi:MAG: LysR family transcriptional regulator [Coriobacteriales bacterium]|nr:LysR family transcriptional regulator [Coriobacteriales bacterium]
MDVFRMKCFVSVAKNRSLSKAAHEMLISQPAMTAQMNALEKELGAKLLVRKKETALTAEGEYALHEFLKILNAIETMQTNVRAMSEEGFGKISIGFHGPYSWAHIDELINAFSQLHPKLQLDIVMATWSELREQLQSRELDVSFMELSEVEGIPEIDSCYLYSEELCAVLPAEHPLANRISIKVSDMANYNIIIPNYRVAERLMISIHDQLVRDGLELTNYCQGNSDAADNVPVAAGLGIAYMPRSFKIRDPKFAFVDIKDAKVYLRMGLAWRSQAMNPTIHDFVDFCRSWDWETARIM